MPVEDRRARRFGFLAAVVRGQGQVLVSRDPIAVGFFVAAAVAGLAGAWFGASYGGSLAGLAGSLAAVAAVVFAAHLVGRYHLRRAATRGHADAQAVLGMNYAYGRGVLQDDLSAYMWLTIAAPRLTGQLRDSATWTRQVVADRLGPDQLEQAQRRAREWDAAHPRKA